MKILKYIGILLLVVLIAATIGVFVMPTEAKIERSITIKAPKEIIWSNVKTLPIFQSGLLGIKKTPA